MSEVNNYLASSHVATALGDEFTSGAGSSAWSPAALATCGRLTYMDAKHMTIGEAMRACRHDAGMNQTEAGRAIGRSQAEVSKYELDVVLPTVYEIYNLEVACHRPPGWVLTAAGFVKPALDVRSAIRMDSGLSIASQDDLLSAYDSALRRI